MSETVPEKHNQPSPGSITRRAFARGAAIAAAASTVTLTACDSACGPPKNPEADAMFHAVLRQHGKLLNDEQKKELRSQIDGTVEGLQKLRTYTLENWDEPAAVLHLPAAASPAPAPAKPAKGAR